MEQIYFDPALPGSFGGVDALKRQSGVSRGQTIKWLSGQDVYTLHKPIRHKFNRRRVLTLGINHLWQADLVDLTSLAGYNDGYKFLLTVIDTFSKFAYVVPLKNKSSQNVKNAFSSIINDSLVWPTYLQTDKGTEFLNSNFQKYLKENGIIHYSVESEMKACIVERFNRTLKNKMWRYFTYKKTYKYIDILQKLVNSYNNSYHRSIKTKPSAVTYSNERQIFRILYPKKAKSMPVKFKFKAGDQVRISGRRKPFDRGYNQRWTNEIFFIKNQIPTDPPTYELEDYGKESIKGKFYEPELQKVKKLTDVFQIEKVLKTRKRKGKVEYLVRWLGYPPKFDSYVDSLILNK